MQTEPAARRRGRPPGSGGAQLLAIARQQFVTRGYPGTTMDAIAAQAGISKQTLYSAHPSKGDLYAAVVRDWVDRGHDALQPATAALHEAANVRDGLRQLAAALQAGILSPPVLQMRALVAAEADAFPDVAADYISRSWDRNMGVLAEALSALAARGALTAEAPDVAAEQFVWLVVGGPLNRLSLGGVTHGCSRRQLERIAHEAVETFLRRYGSGPLA